eukprot:3712282-Rhodomonas_salina.4
MPEEKRAKGQPVFNQSWLSLGIASFDPEARPEHWCKHDKGDAFRSRSTLALMLLNAGNDDKT